MEPFIGQIQAFGFNFAPQGWAFCDGQLLPISQNSALFSLIGTTFGGDGETTLSLPELRGRSIVHVGNGPGLSNINWGQKNGSESKTLSINELPSHAHQVGINFGEGLGNSASPVGNYLASHSGSDTIYTSSSGNANLLANDAMSLGNSGGQQPFNIRNPYLGIYVCIALTGLFPSSN